MTQLDDEDVSNYSAIVVLTRIVSWKLEPDMEGRTFDAVTSASILESADSVTEEILEKVYAIIDAEA